MTNRSPSKDTPDDQGWLEAAIAIANVPTLACVLVQLTGDRRWIDAVDDETVQTSRRQFIA